MNNNFKWSDEQQAIFKWFENETGNAIVRALAGTAKTTTIIEGLNRAKEKSMAYFVFNKRNQVEAIEKIKNPNVTVKTLHSIGFSLLLEHWRGVRGDGYTEYNRIKKLAPDAPAFVMFQASKLVSYLKNTFFIPTDKEIADTAILKNIDTGKYANEGWPQERLIELASKSIKLSLEYPLDKKISFDDMIWLPCVLKFIRPIFDLCALDESQDCNILQLTIVTGVCKPTGRLVLVGDEKQMIYAWRGAMKDCMKIFQNKLKAKEFTLTTTYRCPRKIVEYINLIVPELKACESAIEGAIQTITDEKMLIDIKVNDTILSRTNFPLVKCCLALLRKNKPAFVLGRDVGKNLINIIKNLGAKSMSDFSDKLQTWLNNKVQKASGSFFATKALEIAQDEYDMLKEIAENVNTLEGIEDKINSLFYDADYVRIPSVVLSTTHKFKGLEANAIYMLSDTYRQGKRKLTPDEADEEKNILYVSYSRTKNLLAFVTSTAKPKTPPNLKD